MGSKCSSGDAGMIFQITDDRRITERCATERCGGQVTHRFEGGGVGSYYCSGCIEKIAELIAIARSQSHDQ